VFGGLFFLGVTPKKIVPVINPLPNVLVCDTPSDGPPLCGGPLSKDPRDTGGL